MAGYVGQKGLGAFAQICNDLYNDDDYFSEIAVVPVHISGMSGEDAADFVSLDSLLQDAGVTERTTGGWNRLTFDKNSSPAIGVSNDPGEQTVELPDFLWSSVSAGQVTHLVVTALWAGDTQNDASRLIMLVLDFPVTPSGNNVVGQWNGQPAFRAERPGA